MLLIWLGYIGALAGVVVFAMRYLFPSSSVLGLGRNPVMLSQQGDSEHGRNFQMKVFPYTGFHFRPAVELKGEMGDAIDRSKLRMATRMNGGKQEQVIETPNFNIGHSRYHYRTNNFGFLTKYEFSQFDHPIPPRNPNERTVLLTGGSSAWGQGATSNETSLSYVLEDRLNREDARKRQWKVVNLAMGGWIAYQEFIALDLYGDEWNSDWVVVVDGRNDAMIPTGHGERVPNYYCFTGEKRLNELLDASPGDEGPKLPFLQVRRLVQRLEKVGERPVAVTTDEEAERAARFYGHSIRSIVRRFSDNQILLVTQPTAVFATPGYYRNIYEREKVELQGLAKANRNVQYIDAASMFDLTNEYFVDDCHMTDKGQAALADRISKAILARERGKI